MFEKYFPTIEVSAIALMTKIKQYEIFCDAKGKRGKGINRYEQTCIYRISLEVY